MWRTDFSRTDYSTNLNRLIEKYNEMTLKAEKCRRDNGGRISKLEANYYVQADDICLQILDATKSEPDLHELWKIRREQCMAMIEEIAAVLAPKPEPPKPAAPAKQTPAPMKQDIPNEPVNSDFVTKNACDDVKAETIEKWYKTKPAKGFDDITGMESLKERLVKETSQLGWEETDKQLKISPVQSYFFYGPPGTGKTSIIHAFAHEMMEKMEKKNQKFNFIQLKGGDIHASYVGVAEKTVQIAFQEAVDNDPCLIFIDEIENVCVDRQKNGIQGHESRLTVAFLEAYNILLESGKRVIFMGATNHPGLVDEAMMDRIKLIKVPLPDEPARAKYFTKAFDNLVLEDGFTIDDMVDKTDNYSYRDMNRLSESIALKMKDVLVTTYQILNEDGNLDQAASDKAASDALKEGKVLLTRAMFEDAQKENTPSDKSRIREELRAFEERAAHQE